jgi:biopolymer transport protein ExbD
VDVVFLLLVFFLLAGVLRPTPPLEVTPPEGRIGEAADPAARTVWLAADGRVAVADEVLPAAIAAEFLARGTGGPVELRADADARARDLLPLLEALRAAGISDIELVVRDRS